MNLNNSDKNIDLLDQEHATGAKQGSGAPIQEGIPAASAFNLTDRLPIFTYLVNSNRIRWYRVIMRVFLQRHRELYRYQLTAQEIRDAVRAILDPDYTLEQCQNDLTALKEWGNITTIYDSSRATSIASFLSPALLYQATPEAIAIETFLEEQTRANTGKGSLRQSDLPRLWESLQLLDEELEVYPLELPSQSREIAEEWQRAFEVWNAMAREAAQYLANMINAAQQDRTDLEAYQLYKAAVVAYVHGFAQTLTQYSRRVRELLSTWSATGKKNRLIQIVAEYLEPPSPTMENRPTQAELLQEARNQVEAITNWFAEGKNADSFRRNALAEVDKVVRRAATLASAARPNANYATHLNALAHQLLQARAQLEELQRVAEFADAEELSERLRMLRERSEALFTELDEAKASYARADERANNTTYNLSEAEEHLRQVQQDRVEKQAHFVDLLTAYPVEALLVVQQVAAGGQHPRAAQKLLEEPVSEGDIPARKEHLEAEYRESYNNLSRTFNREQSILLEYGPDLDDQGNILFLNENKSRPVELLELLSGRIEMQKMLLGQEERQLFEDFLLQEMAEAIRTHILESEEWVQQINSVLSGLPMIDEHYALQWKQPAEFDMAKLGSHLAQHYRLLRKPAQTLTAEETETLMNAFRREIEAVRIQQQENPAMNFMEALEQVFDYREWFHFDVLVTPIGGQRQRLTDRVAGTRSGAEQLFALYVPLFAALGALYRSAAPGAPRLLALDEAFDKVSVANTQRIMEFLVSQDFQWIMTGPQISGTGAKIPACARYLMIHEKGSPIATASATFWSDNYDIQAINDTHNHSTPQGRT